ncbi:MAG TPA: hypothetical protein PLL25_10110 [Flavobacteriales bacterium]|nr:hypothetical protein [Flavobacteriales bacterium]
MQRFKAYALGVHVLLLTCTSSGLLEVFRIPALFKHYAEHQQQGGDRPGMTEFLLLHYFDNGHEESDPKGHAELPFHGGGAHSPIADGSGPLALTLIQLDGAPTPSVPPADEHIGKWPGRSVFQPPKLG